MGDETILLVPRRRSPRPFALDRRPAVATAFPTGDIDSKPSFAPDPANFSEEVWGVEDPRLTWVAEREEWIIAYTAFSPSGPMVSLATTKDFSTFHAARASHAAGRQGRGRLSPPLRQSLRDDPSTGIRRQLGRAHLALVLARPDALGRPPHPAARARGRLVGREQDRPQPAAARNARRAGCCLYHGVRHTAGGCLYRLGLALLDLENPWQVLRRSDEWIFAPEMPYERQGDVNGVVFPCGWILDEETGTIRMYYGGADSCLALATAQLSDVLSYLRSCPRPAPQTDGHDVVRMRIGRHWL